MLQVKYGVVSAVTSFKMHLNLSLKNLKVSLINFTMTSSNEKYERAKTPWESIKVILNNNFDCTA